MSTVLDLVRADLREFTLYDAADSDAAAVRLHANELPWRPEGDAGERGLNRYPEPRPAALRRRLAKRYGVEQTQLLLTRGSDDGIDLLVRTFCAAGQDRVLICTPCFGMYAGAARLQGAAIDEAPLDAGSDFDLDADTVGEALTDGTKLIFLCSPNNPTGTVFQRAQLARICVAAEGRALVVVDEAYIEFSSLPSITDMLAEFDNLVVLRTLSKAYGLAGIRLGAVVAGKSVIGVLNRILTPYPLPSACVDIAYQATGEDALGSLKEKWATIIAERRNLSVALEGIPAVVRTWPSEANFVLAKMNDARTAAALARRHGYLVRELHGPLSDCLRITVGTADENAGLLDILRGLRA